MSRSVLILRPAPGASQTAARAQSLGLAAVITPLFTSVPIHWEAPLRGDFDAILLTSANATRLGGPKLEAFMQMPCYAVGDATASAAAESGFTDVRTGPSEGAALVRMAAGEGVRHALHFCGRDHIDLDSPELAVTACPIYAAEGVDMLPSAAMTALKEDVLVLLHSPRAAELFARLTKGQGINRERVELAAISQAASDAAGSGWRAKHVAAAPRDEDLLELAAGLCKIGDGQ